MITSRNFFVALSLVGIFCLSFAIMWQRRDGAERPSARPVSPSAPVTPPPIATSNPQVPAVVEAPSASIPPPAASAPAQSKYDGPELPVIFTVATRRVYTTEDGSDGEPVNVTKNVTEGVVINSSDGPLTITVTEVNGQTHEKSQAQIVLAQNMQKRFGADQGLSMLSGDEITLRNPSYQELTRQVP